MTLQRGRVKAKGFTMTAIAHHFGDLLSQKIDFSQFFHRTNGYWRRMADNLIKYMGVPLGVDLEDVEQEIKLNVARFIPKWDSTRGMALDVFVTRYANQYTKRWYRSQFSNKKGVEVIQTVEDESLFELMSNLNKEDEPFQERVIGIMQIVGKTKTNRKMLEQLVKGATVKEISDDAGCHPQTTRNKLVAMAGRFSA